MPIKTHYKTRLLTKKRPLSTRIFQRSTRKTLFDSKKKELNEINVFTPSSESCELPVIANAIFSPLGDITHGATVNVSCKTGYTLVGPSSMKCDDGKLNQTSSCKGENHLYDLYNLSSARISSQC